MIAYGLAILGTIVDLFYHSVPSIATFSKITGLWQPSVHSDVAF